MATRVELDKTTTQHAIEGYLASLKRQHNTTKQQAFKPIIEKDIAALQAALGTLSEIK